jgi:hypothetical protein
MRRSSRILAGAAIAVFAWLLSGVVDNDALAEFGVQGSAPPVCLFSEPHTTQASNMAIGVASSTRSTLNISRLADSATAQLLSASITVVSKGTCNHAHTFTIATKNGGLNTPTSAGGFANHVDYTATVSWGSSNSQLQTTALEGQKTPNSIPIGAYAGDMQLQISINQDGARNLPLVAGVYTDDLTITFQPQM